MTIQKATLKDVAELNKLINSAYRGESSKKGWTTEAHLLDGLRIDEETLNSYFEDINVVLLKNIDGHGAITGSVYLEHRGPKLYVGMFSVSPEFQDKGIGRALLLAAEKYAAEINCATLTMTVISTRTELIDWYKRRGFEPTGEVLPFHEGTKFGTPKETIELLVLEKHI